MSRTPAAAAIPMMIPVFAVPDLADGLAAAAGLLLLTLRTVADPCRTSGS